MRSPLAVLSVVTATLLFFQSSPLQLSATAGGISGAIAQEQAVPDRQSEITQLLEAGVEATNQKIFQEALQKFEQALAMSQEMGDRDSEEIALNNMAVVYRRLGEYNRALELFEQAFDINRDSDILISMGNIYLKLGENDQAIATYQQVFEISRDISNDTEILISIGNIYLKLDKYDQAIEAYQNVLRIYHSNLSNCEESDLLNTIGKVYEIQGQNDQAREFYRQAQQVSDQLCTKEDALVIRRTVLRDDDDQLQKRPTLPDQNK